MFRSGLIYEYSITQIDSELSTRLVHILYIVNREFRDVRKWCTARRRAVKCRHAGTERRNVHEGDPQEGIEQQQQHADQHQCARRPVVQRVQLREYEHSEDRVRGV